MQHEELEKRNGSWEKLIQKLTSSPYKKTFLSSQDFTTAKYQGRMVVIYVHAARSFLNKFRYGPEECSKYKFHEILKYRDVNSTKQRILKRTILWAIWLLLVIVMSTNYLRSKKMKRHDWIKSHKLTFSGHKQTGFPHLKL